MKQTVRRFRDFARQIKIQSSRTLLQLSPLSTLTVFMYHSVTTDAERNWGPWRYAVTPMAFDEQISSIARRYDVVTMDDVSSHIDSSEYTLPEKAAVVTFDDGYRDFLKEALPVLERHKIPATVYVTTGLMGETCGPFEFRLAEALRQRSKQSLSISDLDVDTSDPLPDDPKRAYSILRQPAKRASPERRVKILEEVEDRPVSNIPMLNSDNIGTLSDHELVTVGAHGHNHVPLTTLSERAVRENITDCRSVLEAIVDSPVNHFSYPYGAYDDQVLRVIQNTKFKTAVTTGPGILLSKILKHSRWCLPRIDAANHSVCVSDSVR